MEIRDFETGRRLSWWEKLPPFLRLVLLFAAGWVAMSGMKKLGWVSTDDEGVSHGTR